MRAWPCPAWHGPGRLESGRLRVGDTLLFSPTDKTARVASIEAWNAAEPVKSAGAGELIGVTLDQQIFVERGEVASHQTLPPMLANVFRARLFWLGRKPLRAGNSYVLKLLTSRIEARIEKIERVIDTGDLSGRTVDAVERNEIAEVIIRTRGIISVDPFATNPRI